MTKEILEKSVKIVNEMTEDMKALADMMLNANEGIGITSIKLEYANGKEVSLSHINGIRCEIKNMVQSFLADRIVKLEKEFNSI